MYSAIFIINIHGERNMQSGGSAGGLPAVNPSLPDQISPSMIPTCPPSLARVMYYVVHSN
jgi:hypothetical protein